LLNFLIQSAISSADYLGFGFGGIKAQELFWVLSRLTVEIHRPMNWYEPIEVETWPKDIERIIYLRDFILRDDEKKIVGIATSGWLAVDMESKRPKRIEGLHAEIFERLKMKSAIDSLPEKLNSVDDGESFEIKSSYYDIDLNRHVTSTRYIDWMMDSFPIDFHLSNYPYKISMNYLKETMPGETIKILRKETGEKQYSFEGINMTGDSSAFRGKIDFRGM
jgi:acyl-ACP thioesterase